MSSKRAGSPPAVASEKVRAPALRLDSPVSALPRVTPADAKRLRRLGLETVRDLLLNLPFGWESFGGPAAIADLRAGADAMLVATVARAAARPTPRRGLEL